MKQAPDSEERPRTLDIRSAQFWRKRILRALLLGALLIAATQLLPNLPQEQRLLFRAPDGKAVTELNFSYFQVGEQEPLGGAQLSFPAPIFQIPHGVSLPNGRYRVMVRAVGKTPAERWTAEKSLELTGGTAVIALDPRP
jgi:hypothetical protein